MEDAKQESPEKRHAASPENDCEVVCVKEGPEICNMDVVCVKDDSCDEKKIPEVQEQVPHDPQSENEHSTDAKVAVAVVKDTEVVTFIFAQTVVSKKDDDERESGVSFVTFDAKVAKQQSGILTRSVCISSTSESEEGVSYVLRSCGLFCDETLDILLSCINDAVENTPDYSIFDFVKLCAHPSVICASYVSPKEILPPSLLIKASVIARIRVCFA